MAPAGSTGGPGGPGEDKKQQQQQQPEKKSEKSYFASAVESINPFTSSRSSSPAPSREKDKAKEMPPPPGPARSSTQKADDHALNTLYGQSFRRYPPECPPLNVKWFHAVDVSAAGAIACSSPPPLTRSLPLSRSRNESRSS